MKLDQIFRTIIANSFKRDLTILLLSFMNSNFKSYANTMYEVHKLLLHVHVYEILSLHNLKEFKF